MLQVVDARKLLDRLGQYRTRGPNGYPLEALWKATLSSYLLNLPHTNALIRRLEADPPLRYVCGFGDPVPPTKEENGSVVFDLNRMEIGRVYVFQFLDQRATVRKSSTGDLAYSWTGATV